MKGLGRISDFELCENDAGRARTNARVYSCALGYCLLGSKSSSVTSPSRRSSGPGTGRSSISFCKSV